VAEGLTFLNSALINANVTALILKPYYTQYPVAIRMFGGKFLEGNYDEKNEWTIDLDGLKGTIRKSGLKNGAIKYILITNPNNPTGTVLSRKALEQMVEIANEYRMLLISDEIYDEIVFRHESFTSIAELAKGIPHVILNGASKAFDATGFRIGYMLVPEKDRSSTELKRKLADYCRVRLSSNTPAQYAIAEGMSNRKEHEREVSQMVASIEENVDSVMKLFDENPFLKTMKPGGAFYIFPRIDLRSMRFPNDKEFVESLIREELIQTTRGSGFGAPNHFRIVALAPRDLMKECAEKINSFCKKHAK
jgi:alanine-synthesizing transaminase